MHLDAVKLVLFDDDMMYYCNSLLFNEQNSSLFYYYLLRKLAFCLFRRSGTVFLLFASPPKPVSSSINKRDANLIDQKMVFLVEKIQFQT